MLRYPISVLFSFLLLSTSISVSTDHVSSVSPASLSLPNFPKASASSPTSISIANDTYLRPISEPSVESLNEIHPFPYHIRDTTVLFVLYPIARHRPQPRIDTRAWNRLLLNARTQLVVDSAHGGGWLHSLGEAFVYAESGVRLTVSSRRGELTFADVGVLLIALASLGERLEHEEVLSDIRRTDTEGRSMGISIGYATLERISPRGESMEMVLPENTNRALDR